MTSKVASEPRFDLYVGTHRKAHRADTGDIAFGIYRFAADTASGPWQAAGLTETPQPGWLAPRPDGRALYAVNEVREGASVTAFTRDPQTGALAFLNAAQLPPMPCHCAVDASGRFLLIATFGGGSVHLFALEDDGQIGAELDRHVHTGSSAHPVRQTTPHAHAVVLSPDEKCVLVPDLGTDSVVVYGLDRAAGRLVPRPERTLRLPPLSGPRHLIFAPDGRHAWLVNEMSATIVTLTWDAGLGSLEARGSVDLLPKSFAGLRSGAGLVVTADGRRLYATTRSHGSSGMPAAPGLDQLVWLDADRDGALAVAGRMPSGGGIPRDLALSPDEQRLYVAHQCSGTIIEFALDEPAPVQTAQAIETPVPVCLLFVESDYMGD